TNGGLSDARNFGIEKSTADLIYLLDSDDFIDKNCIKALYNQQVIHNADVVFSNYFNYIESDNTFAYYIMNKDFKIDDVHPFEAIIRQSKWKYNTPSYIIAQNKLYKKKLFNNINYPKGRIFEDEATTHKLFMNSKKIISIDASYYCYRIRNNSIMTENFSAKKAEDLIYIVNEKLSDIVLYGNGKYLEDTRNKMYRLLNIYKNLLEDNNLKDLDVYKYILTKINLYKIGNEE
ncbi:glycosyltransferase family 2 protein, partial [Gemelliphila palaticanis]